MNIRLVTAAVALMMAAVQAFATEGINLIGIGPVQQGTAGAGVAAAKDSTWLILNPAGLADVAPGMDTSFQVFAPVRTIDSTLSAGAGEQKDDSMFVIPAISGSFGCCHGEHGYIGLGLYGTSGMGVDYDYGRISPTNFPSSFGDTMTELSVAKMTATYAYKFDDSGISVGAGPIFVFSRLRTDMLNPMTFAFESGSWDTAYGVGAIIGVTKKFEKLSLGGSYMTEQWMTEFDGYDSLLADSLNLPQQLTVGAAYDVCEAVELVLDYRWTGWNELDTLGDQFGWEDQHIVKAGLTWTVDEALTLRGGISHGESPIDADAAFGNALFPAIMETHLACGASYVADDNLSVHISYIHALENEVTASGRDAGPMGPFAAGTEISMYQNSLTLGLTYSF